jgi:hypothetical protein
MIKRVNNLISLRKKGPSTESLFKKEFIEVHFGVLTMKLLVVSG